jgi:hypothetical protein
MTALVATVAALACSALFTAAASAVTAGWMVNGTMLGTTAALATTTVVDEGFQFLSNGPKITCSGLRLSGNPEIRATSRLSATFVFTGCASAQENCSLTTTEVSTVPLLAELTLESVLAGFSLVKPETGTQFASFTLAGATCANAGLTLITGRLLALWPTLQDERTSQLFNINDTSQAELRTGVFGVRATGSALLKLASGLPWSFL